MSVKKTVTCQSVICTTRAIIVSYLDGLVKTAASLFENGLDRLDALPCLCCNVSFDEVTSFISWDLARCVDHAACDCGLGLFVISQSMSELDIHVVAIRKASWL